MVKTNCFKEFAKYVSLNVMGMIGLSCYILADTYFVSQGLGTYGLTALNLAIPIYSFIHGSGLMIGMGGGTRYSIQRLAVKYAPDDNDAHRQAAIDRDWVPLCMLEMTIEHMTGKEAKELIKEKQQRNKSC